MRKNDPHIWNSLTCASEFRRKDALRLADQHGCWCAWCFEYISRRDELELHHMFGRAGVRQIFGDEPFLESWTLPVHRGRCHHLLQHATDTSTAQLIQAQSLPLRELERACQESFFAGDLSRALYLREVFHRRLTTDHADVPRTHIVREFNAAAGSTLLSRLMSANSPIGKSWRHRRKTEMELTEKDWIRNVPSFEFYAGDLYANAGYFVKAAEVLHQLEADHPRWQGRRHSAWGAILRRTAILQADLNAAREASYIAAADCDYYNLRTALLAQGWSHIARGQYIKAVDDFIGVVDAISWRPLSLWHRYCRELGLGCAFYLLEGGAGLRVSLGCLLRAQYIGAIFGLRGNPVPDPRSTTHSELVIIEPTEAVYWMALAHRQQTTVAWMRTLRLEQIQAMQEDLLRTFSRPLPPL